MYCKLDITTVWHKQVDYWENVQHNSAHFTGLNWLFYMKIVLHKAIVCFLLFPRESPRIMVVKGFYFKCHAEFSNCAPSVLKYDFFFVQLWHHFVIEHTERTGRLPESSSSDMFSFFWESTCSCFRLWCALGFMFLCQICVEYNWIRAAVHVTILVI